MTNMRELGLPVRKWVPNWLALISIFIIILPITMLNGSYTGSMLEVSNTLGTNTEDITMGYYAASAGMAIAIPSYRSPVCFLRQVSFARRSGFAIYIKLDMRPLAKCGYSNCCQFCHRLSERIPHALVYPTCTKDIQSEKCP